MAVVHDLDVGVAKYDLDLSRVCVVGVLYKLRQCNVGTADEPLS